MEDLSCEEGKRQVRLRQAQGRTGGWWVLERALDAWQRSRAQVALASVFPFANGKMLFPPASSPVEPSEEAEIKPISHAGPLERSTGLT